MRKYIGLAALAILLMGANLASAARTGRSSGKTGAGGDFGLGIIIGEPTGLSVKYWLSPKSAIDGGFAWSFRGDGAVHIHGDYLRHDFNLIHVEEGQMAIYYGIGGRILIFSHRNYYYDDEGHRHYYYYDHNDNSVFVGLRVPVGLEYIFQGNHVDLFLELAPVLDIVPETDLDLNGGIGIRYFF